VATHEVTHGPRRLQRPRQRTEVYFIRKDNSSLLSFSLNEDIFTLDMVNWSSEHAGHPRLP
jgi:hypothetical protein